MSTEQKIAVTMTPELARHAAMLLAGAAPTSTIAEQASQATRAITGQVDKDLMVGTALAAVDDLLLAALSILATANGADRLPSGLEDLVASIETLREEVVQVKDDIACITCGDFNNDGEGEDGYCGNCADTHYDDQGRHIGPPVIT